MLHFCYTTYKKLDKIVLQCPIFNNKIFSSCCVHLACSCQDNPRVDRSMYIQRPTGCKMESYHINSQQCLYQSHSQPRKYIYLFLSPCQTLSWPSLCYKSLGHIHSRSLCADFTGHKEWD